MAKRPGVDIWSDADLVYTAHAFGCGLCPFIQTVGELVYPEFLPLYEQYPGILVGGRHALCKKGWHLLDPFDGKWYDWYGAPYQKLTERIFFAWTHSK